MNNMLQEDFHSVDELTIIEALSLLNRWVKSDYKFYYQDKDELYAIKDEWIRRLLKTKDLSIACVLKRKNPTFLRIEKAVANRGSDLEPFLNSPDYEPPYWHHELYELTQVGKEYDYPLDIQILRKAEFERQMEVYRPLAQANSRLQNAYSQDLNDWRQRRSSAAKKWAEDNGIKLARSNSGKSLKKDWVERLEKEGFSFEKKPDNPRKSGEWNHCIKPPSPVLTYTINSLEGYLSGSDDELDSAIAACMKAYPQIKSPCEITENFLEDIGIDLEQQYHDELRFYALELLEKGIRGEFQSPQEFYDALTSVPVSYEEAIGLRSGYNFRIHDEYHYKYGKWAEINLDPKGFWLFEFITSDNVMFHSPYRHMQNNLDVDESKLEYKEYEEEFRNFGRGLTSDEQQKYPLEKVLKVLEVDRGRFPHGLMAYMPLSWQDFEDEVDLFF